MFQGRDGARIQTSRDGSVSGRRRTRGNFIVDSLLEKLCSGQEREAEGWGVKERAFFFLDG